MKKVVLRNQIFIALITTVLCVAVIYGLIAFPLEIKRRNTLLNKIELYLNAIVINREEQLANELYLKHKNSLSLIAKKIAGIKEIVDISVFDSNADLFFELQGQGPKKLNPDYINAIANTNNKYVVVEENWKKMRVLTYTCPIIVIDELQGYFQIRYNIAEVLNETRMSIILFFTLLLTILIFLFVLLNFMLSRFVIKPIDGLMEAMTRVKEGKLGEQVIVSSNNEISEMAKIFNLMSKENAGMYNDLQRANIELSSVRNYLSNIINSMPSILVGVDKNGNVTQWNMTAEQTTGMTAAVAQGKPLSDVFPKMASHIKTIKESIKTREIRQEQNIPNLSEENINYEDITIYPLIANGVEGAVIRVDDVTEKVQLEEMMIQSEKMLSVGGLAAGMAHEINNPIAGMVQTANVMANRLGARIDMPANLKAAEKVGTSMETIQKFMEIRGIPKMITAINESGLRVAEIVNNMLSFARKSDAMVSSHAITDLLDKTLELAATDFDLKKKYDFKKIEIKKKYEDRVPPVPCEETKIQQVLLNILQNGAQAMQEAEIKNPIFIIRTWFEENEKMVCMEIKDNGPGMEKKIRRRIFEPFFTTKPIGVGTGLGLSVSYFIITENHGGEMGVESTPGHGAKFIIRLPLEKTKA